MALISCKECGTQISNQATACPKCGMPLNLLGSPATTSVATPAGNTAAPNAKAKKSGCAKFFLILVGIFVFLIVAGQIGEIFKGLKRTTMTPEEIKFADAAEAEKSNDANARFVCTNFVRDSLKAPTTADFQSSNEYLVRKQPDGAFAVAGYVDSQNSFGAKIRGTFACTVKQIPSGKWRLVEPVLVISK